MNILNKRIFLVEKYRLHPRLGKYDVSHNHVTFLVFCLACVFHFFLNIFSSDKIFVRIIGSYVSLPE